jgi:hypothetical protein
VGERPSPLAARKGWDWTSGRVCAKTLAEALDACGLPRSAWTVYNPWAEPGLGRPRAAPDLAPVLAAAAAGVRIIALGRLASGALRAAQIPHTYMVHPAARGAIRRRARYHAHVASVLADEGGTTGDDGEALQRGG